MPIDLLILEMSKFDVILGMDWSSKYDLVIDYALQSLHFCFLGEEPFDYDL